MLDGWKRRLWERFGIPRMIRDGWRLSQAVPLDDRHLAAPFGYDEEPAIKQAVRAVRGHTMVSFERLASLWQQVRYLDRCGVEGALVECGTWKGGCMGMMALAHLASGPPRRALHLFDSFEGLPEPRPAEDGAAAVEYAANKATGALSPIGQCVGSLADNRDLLERRIGYPGSLLAYHPGWFQDTLPALGPGELDRIALLRLDGDWYESTRVCLERLYGRVARGGVVVLDDYGHWEGCRRATDEFLAALGEPVLLGHIDYTGRYWVRVGGEPGA